jgi:PrsW family intramembrane metalloprotease
VAALVLLAGLSHEPRERLYEINAYIGTAVVTIALGGMLVYQASSSLGATGSSAMRLPRQWFAWGALLAAVFLASVSLGQEQVNHPGTLPWLFPVTNLAIVTIPSTLVAITVTKRYLKFNPFAWPLSIREWTTGIIYGAVGATTVASIINTAYLVGMGVLLIHTEGRGDVTNLSDNLPTLPTAWGVFFDISVLSIVAPLNEEFWKGMLVAFFFFRKGNAARCFLWGVLAGAGFNLLETFQNSLSVVSPDVVSARTIGDQWWLFASARGGTAAIHATATGVSALGFYGLLRRKKRFMLGYPAGVTIHGAWNFLNYTLAGDAFFTKSGPDSTLLDVLSVLGLCALFLACVVALWEMPRRLRDGVPAPIYRILGMLPRVPADLAPATEAQGLVTG